MHYVIYVFSYYIVLLVICCGVGVSEGSSEGMFEGNSAACASVRPLNNTTKMPKDPDERAFLQTIMTPELA